MVRDLSRRNRPNPKQGLFLGLMLAGEIEERERLFPNVCSSAEAGESFGNSVAESSKDCCNGSSGDNVGEALGFMLFDPVDSVCRESFDFCSCCSGDPSDRWYEWSELRVLYP